MGCDISSFAEVRNKTTGEWERSTALFPEGRNQFTKEPFGWRHYGMFGFLADVRNYSDVPVISQPKGLPDDLDLRDLDGHSYSWLSLKELLDFNYDQEFEDLRTTKETSPNCFDGKHVAEPGEGTKTTVREFLGEGFFEHIEVLKALGEPEDVRIVFWFDS